jgi:hypothetical protein
VSAIARPASTKVIPSLTIFGSENARKFRSGPLVTISRETCWPTPSRAW